ncbi:hypothetical protein M406DRAFT_75793 [Cryphonectria parasitica EP155]|uniref:Uncharacterized protein n=1 Tax=Cryphonectria parasitica (strain ATCC 38755 / EP155) TaxID=660469 RepID=A0A9P5CTD9_CRYP1|nr:uncharacterized protein M406DRAFT_75793 [Cryphonectria parasitica EP155]KAF3769311.1 hypothetical protein M406DRAFT_75793 [Cryphonectria parasitica EP155]
MPPAAFFPLSLLPFSRKTNKLKIRLLPNISQQQEFASSMFTHEAVASICFHILTAHRSIVQLFNILGTALMGLVLTQAAPACHISSSSSEMIVAGNKTYAIVPIQWTVQINNTESPYNLTIEGTKQDVFHSITRVDPDAAANINNTVNAITTALFANHTSSAIPGIHDDATYTPINHFCNVAGWGRCSVDRLYQGIAYLDGVPGQPSNGPGPGTCGRVSCSYSAAIFWCNDNMETKVLDSFGSIGDGVERIIDVCSVGSRALVDGQQFFSDGWNAIARYDAC